MKPLIVLLMLSATPDSSVTACGNACCVSSSQTPVTLGGTLQVSQGHWPDGGYAMISAIVPGASTTLTGIQFDPPDGGNNATPDIILRSRNSRSAKDPIVSVRANAAELARFGVNSSFFRLLDGGAQTATVPLNSNCVCNDVTDNTKGVKAPVSTNTATISGTTGDSVACLCL